MGRIERIVAREILDSRGMPTVECTLTLSTGARGTASVPSGASRGKREACELRDGNHRFGGKGVLKALRNIQEEISPTLCQLPAPTQSLVDETLLLLDETPDKSRLGGNAILAVSLAFGKAFAEEQKIPLYEYIHHLYRGKSTGFETQEFPVPFMNVINGGAHSDSPLSIQEFLVIPFTKTGFSTALRMGAEVYHTLKDLLSEKEHSISLGDEGGFAPKLYKTREALSFLMQAIEKAGYRPGEDIFLGLDVAASMLLHDSSYHLDDSTFTTASLISFYESLWKEYPLLSLEDPLGEEDWEGWKALTQRLGKDLILIGDDLFVTSYSLLNKGIQERVANAILIKPNQVGTLTETLKVIQRASEAGYKVIVSHRSGETNDSFIADLAVGVGAYGIKAGAPARGERLAKYNRLLIIESEHSQT